MTEVRISDPVLLDELLHALRERADAVVEVVSPDTVAVNLLGSYGSAGHQMAVELRLRAWEAAQRAQGRMVSAAIVASKPSRG